jgi:DNA-binding MarR family transcriptional regulator
MKNKQLGLFLISSAIVMAMFLGYFRINLVQAYEDEIISLEGGMCEHTGEKCPFDKINRLLLPTILSVGVLLTMFLLGTYLIFFDKSEERWQKTQSTLVNKIEDVKTKEIEKQKTKAFLSALSEDEKTVVMKLKEQDGMTQSTLRYRVDFSKAKLSSILKELEQKEIIKKVPHKRTNKIFLRKSI